MTEALAIAIAVGALIGGPAPEVRCDLPEESEHGALAMYGRPGEIQTKATHCARAAGIGQCRTLRCVEARGPALFLLAHETAHVRDGEPLEWRANCYASRNTAELGRLLGARPFAVRWLAWWSRAVVAGNGFEPPYAIPIAKKCAQAKTLARRA